MQCNHRKYAHVCSSYENDVISEININATGLKMCIDDSVKQIEVRHSSCSTGPGRATLEK